MSLIFKIIVLVTFLVTVGLYFWSSNRNEVQLSARVVCDEKTSNLTANYLKLVMNPDISPCDDFAEFVCGKGIEIAKLGTISKFEIIRKLKEEQIGAIVKTRSITSDMSPNRKRLGKFFASCIDTNTIKGRGLEPLVDVLKKVGGSPVLGAEIGWTTEEDFDWVELILKARKLGLDHEILFSISPSIDETGTHLLIITSPANGKMNNEIPAILKRLNPIDDLSRRLKDVIKFRKALYDVDLNLNFQNTKSITLKLLKRLTRNIDWSRLLNELFGKAIEDSAKVILPQVEYFINLDKLLRYSRPALIADHMIISIIESCITYFSDDMSIIADDLSREEACVEQTKQNLDLAIFIELVHEIINPGILFKAKEMVQLIKTELGKSINESKWISEKTKEVALEKLDTVKQIIACPEELLNDTFVEEVYRDLDSLSQDQYFENILRLKKFNCDRYYDTHGANAIDQIWAIHSISISNAFYVPQFNSIHLLAPVIQFPFFAEFGEGYLNFGSLGSIVGHELSHGFDPHGATFDKNGEKKFWWDNETKDEFLRRAQCFVRQYDNLPIPNVKGITLDGKKTLGENIADNGGYLVAYRAYKKWLAQNGAEPKLVGLPFNEDQLFWISAASNWCIHHDAKKAKILALIDVHSPPKYRINIPFSNLPEFSQAFNCPLGSPMNPQHKCSLF